MSTNMLSLLTKESMVTVTTVEDITNIYKIIQRMLYEHINDILSVFTTSRWTEVK